MTVISSRFDHLGQDGAEVRLGIMGGTFDPIHIGHLACAEQAREHFGLDAVIFIPTGNPAHKQGKPVTPALQRLDMCRLACLPNPHFDVSPMEIERGGLTYAVDTVRELREHFPENVRLVYITGADSILSIARWKDSGCIAQMVDFVAATRPGYEVTESFKQEIAALGDFRISYFQVTSLAISSSELRQMVGEGYSLRYLTTLSVCEYIFRHRLYRTPETVLKTASPQVVDDPHASAVAPGTAESDGQGALSQAFYDARHEDLKTRVSARRLAHIEGVAETAAHLATVYGVDRDKAHLAGLLHDWDKGYGDEEIRQRALDPGLEGKIPPEVIYDMPQVLHGHTAAAALGRDFPQIPADVLQAIDRHTTAAVDMTPLDMVVYIADALEPGRQFGDIDELRALIGHVSLEELFLRVYEYWTFLLLSRQRPLHPDTIKVWNAYAKRVPKRKDNDLGKRN